MIGEVGGRCQEILHGSHCLLLALRWGAHAAGELAWLLFSLWLCFVWPLLSVVASSYQSMFHEEAVVAWEQAGVVTVLKAESGSCHRPRPGGGRGGRYSKLIC